MSEEQDTSPSFAFWVIGAVALLWNLMGLYAYYTDVSATPQQLAQQFTPEQVAMIEATPPWATSATAIAVTAGVIASLLLLLRNSLAVPLFAVSLAAVAVQDVYIFGMTNAAEAFGAVPVVLQTIVFIIAAFLVWYAMQQKKRGVIT